MGDLSSTLASTFLYNLAVYILTIRQNMTLITQAVVIIKDTYPLPFIRPLTSSNNLEDAGGIPAT